MDSGVVCMVTSVRRASTVTTKEAVDLRDPDPNRFGMGVLHHSLIYNELIAPK